MEEKEKLSYLSGMPLNLLVAGLAMVAVTMVITIFWDPGRFLMKYVYFTVGAGIFLSLFSIPVYLYLCNNINKGKLIHISKQKVIKAKFSDLADTVSQLEKIDFTILAYLLQKTLFKESYSILMTNPRHRTFALVNAKGVKFVNFFQDGTILLSFSYKVNYQTLPSNWTAKDYPGMFPPLVFKEHRMVLLNLVEEGKVSIGDESSYLQREEEMDEQLKELLNTVKKKK